MADEEKLSSWASLIPEVYFDLIARIPAGGAVVAGLVGYFAPDLARSATRVTSFVPALALLLFFVLISYGAGLMLTPFSGLIARGSRLVVWPLVRWDHPDLENLCGRFAALQYVGGRLLKSVLLEETMCEIVCTANEVAQSLLPKMRAEAEFCDNFSVAALLLAILPLAVPVREGAPCQYFKFLVAFSVFAAFAGMYRTYRLLDRQVIFLRVLALRQPSRPENGTSD